MNYNTDPALWRNYGAGLPNGGAVLIVWDGMIHNGLEVLARFNTSADAVQCLKDAGIPSHKVEVR